MINDAHCHFFSPAFFQALGREKGLPGEESAHEIPRSLGWDAPGSVAALADRWIRELDRHQVARCALMASVPGDETSILEAVQRHPDRLVGFFMVDPTRPQSVAQTETWLAKGLRCICLFPAMHRFSLEERAVFEIFESTRKYSGCAIFIHCGVLTVGLRRKLGLPSRFDLRYSNPILLHSLALAYPHVPIIIPHFGSGMLRETLMLADLCQNVYLDTSSSNRWTRYCGGLRLSQVFQQALQVVGPDRLLFGTDSSFFPRGWRQDVWEAQTVALETLGLKAEVRRQIVAGNFDRLFPP